MTWFRIDDAFWRHRKVRKLAKDKLAGAGLWTLAGSWCSDNVESSDRDGWIPTEAVEDWDPKRRVAARLVAVGLWHEVEHDGEPGYQFHDWDGYQRTREEIMAERDVWRAKKAAQRKGRPKDPLSPGDTSGDTRETPQGNPPKSPPRFPDPIPSPFPSSGAFRGEGHLSDASAKKPPSKCPEHENNPEPPNCGACRTARLTAEQWQRDNAAATARCGLCDGDGWRWDPAGKHRGVTSQRCDHRREAQATG